MKNSKIYSFLLFLFITGASMAQQDPSYIFYRYNMNYVNPAYAGAQQRTLFSTNVRSQWSGVAGAPETQSFMASTYFGKNVGFGLSVVNDKTFIERQTSIALDFSYKVQWDETTHIYLGIKASGNSYNANTDGLRTFGIGSDPSLMDLNGGINPNVGMGIYLEGNKFSMSLSAPKILKPRRLEQQDGLARLGRNKMHLYLMGTYDFIINENWTLRPSSMLRYIENSPISLDLTFLSRYKDLLEFGLAYRLDEGVAALLLLDLGKGLTIGYAYEASIQSSLNNTNNGTHEVFMAIQL